MNKPLLSICIPTYNRSKYLKECLDSIVIQLEKDEKLIRLIEIIISDNNSKDDTEELIHNFQKKYSFIKYFKNKINIGAVKNGAKLAMNAKGTFIWLLADDDAHKKDSIKTAIRIISNSNQDIIICNSDQFSTNVNKPTFNNSLQISKDVLINNRKDLFLFLESKFIYTIDWYLNFVSSFIFKRQIYFQNKYLIKKYNGFSDVSFSQAAIIYYSKKNYSIYYLAKPLVMARMGSHSWIQKDQIKNTIKWSNAITNEYLNIIGIHKDILSVKFISLAFIRIIISRAGIVLALITSLFPSKLKMYKRINTLFDKIVR